MRKGLYLTPQTCLSGTLSSRPKWQVKKGTGTGVNEIGKREVK